MTDESSVFDAALSGFQLGQSDTLLRLSSATEFAQAEQVLLAQARRQLFILTYDLEPSRFNDDAFVSAVSAFVRRSRFSDARVLIGDPAIAIRWGHKLVACPHSCVYASLMMKILTTFSANQSFGSWPIIEVFCAAITKKFFGGCWLPMLFLQHSEPHCSFWKCGSAHRLSMTFGYWIFRRRLLVWAVINRYFALPQMGIHLLIYSCI